MGEGAACLILERDAHARGRGATPLAEVAGAAAAFDPDVFWGQPPRVDLMRDVVDRALRESGVTAEQIDLVVSGAHGDPVCDAAEAALLVNLFDGRRVPIMAVCAQIGAADGATGAFQAAAAVLALRDRRIGGRAASTESPLDLVDRSRPFDGATCLVTAFGSLGERMALVIKRPN
jgi:3-oxoacyl-(acyl-carrier-protein) synthase